MKKYQRSDLQLGVFGVTVVAMFSSNLKPRIRGTLGWRQILMILSVRGEGLEANPVESDWLPFEKVAVSELAAVNALTTAGRSLIAPEFSVLRGSAL